MRRFPTCLLLTAFALFAAPLRAADWPQWRGPERTGVWPEKGLPDRFPADGLKPLQAAARERRNVFASLMEAVKTHSLGQVSHALYDVGGEYRRNM